MSIQTTFETAVWLALTLGLAACAAISLPAAEPSQPASATAASDESRSIPSTPTSLPAKSLPDMGLAPDITNQVWLNTDRPLNLEALRGKVVLVEFWTFG